MSETSDDQEPPGEGEQRQPRGSACAAPSVALVIQGRPRDLGGFSVRRVLPAAERRLVGPFIFLDQMGPADILPGRGFDVRPHPHIALATLTYLFSGEIVHRDSLGFEQTIRPGDVNWMVAGRGIVHSERVAPALRQTGFHIHGLQCWLALPREQEECAPSFVHHPRASIPRLTRAGVELDVVAGSAFGQRSPVEVFSPTLYVHARLPAGASLEIEREHEERAVYVIEGSVECEEQRFEPGALLVLEPHVTPVLRALEPTRLMLLGGAHLPGSRHIYWNFVSSSLERIEQAKRDWQEDKFAKVPGDDERIPLPS
ncbi:MAG TPA: pirin family protein [Polyangiaceae bacterium]|nr:pirin family protein [Polyangiaceae bacterium]